MRRSLGLAVMLFVPLVQDTSGSANAEEHKHKRKATGDPGNPIGTEKDIKAGILVGLIPGLPEIDKKKRTLHVFVNYVVTSIDPDAVKQVAVAQHAVRAARDLNMYQYALLNLQAAQERVNKKTVKFLDVEVEAGKDTAIRNLRLKSKFGEKGRLLEYTEAEMKELKGDGKLPGYKAEFGDLQEGQFVQVTLAKKKGAAPAPKKGGDAIKEAIGEGLRQASVIVILRDPPPER